MLLFLWAFWDNFLYITPLFSNPAFLTLLNL